MRRHPRSSCDVQSASRPPTWPGKLARASERRGDIKRNEALVPPRIPLWRVCTGCVSVRESETTPTRNRTHHWCAGRWGAAPRAHRGSCSAGGAQRARRAAGPGGRTSEQRRASTRRAARACARAGTTVWNTTRPREYKVELTLDYYAAPEPAEPRSARDELPAPASAAHELEPRSRPLQRPRRRRLGSLLVALRRRPQLRRQRRRGSERLRQGLCARVRRARL